MSFEALMSVGSELWSTLVASNNVHCPLRKRTFLRRSLQYRFWVQEAGKNILEYPRDVVVIAIVTEAAAEGDRPGREHSPVLRCLEKHHVGADEVLMRGARPGRHMGQVLLRHEHKTVAVPLRARQDDRVFRCSEAVVHPVELLDWATGGPQPDALSGTTLSGEKR